MKKYLLMLGLMLSLGLGAAAQTMTDDQVVEYVKKEQANGTSQATIASKLMQRGVTTAQLQRIRRKLERQKEAAADALGSKKNEDPDSRMRNGEITTNQTNSERRNQLNDELGFLNEDQDTQPDGMLMEEEIDPEEQVFGRNIFNNELLTFQPAQNIATPPNYVLGAGDKVYIDIWGASQESIERTISPDGTVVIDGVGPIKLAGLSVQRATSALRQKLGRYYADCQFSLSLGDTRSIQVQVMGEVRTPGTFTLSSLSSTFNALYSAGGISDIGSLRNIRIFRQGRQVGTLDVYDYLLNGNAAGDVRLQDNDVIIVSPYECLVKVRGKVKRPMFYEMRSSETVQQLIKNAGGFAGDAYTGRVTLTRKSGREKSIHTIDEFQASNFTLMDGDEVEVDSVVDRFTNRLSVRGAVRHPGDFELGKDIQTLRQLIQAADGLREDAMQERAIIQREKADLTKEMVSANLAEVLAGTAPDVALKKGDVVYVPSRSLLYEEGNLTILGEVTYPGSYDYAEGTTVEDLVLMAGGLNPGASHTKVDVFRRIIDNDAQERSGEMSEMFTVSLSPDYRHSEKSLVLMPFDRVVVRRSPDYGEQQNVSIGGNVNFPGSYTITSSSYRLSDLIKAAGGLSLNANISGARLTRQYSEEERMMRDISMRLSQIALYEEALKSEKNYNLELADSLLEIKMDLSNNYTVGIELDKAMAHPGSDEDILLRDGDMLSIPEHDNTVRISGEVNMPNNTLYHKGKSANYYIKRAGGITRSGRKKDAFVIGQNGAVHKVGRRGSKWIKPGSEIVVPKREEGRKMTPAETAAISSVAASLTSVIIALITLLK